MFVSDSGELVIKVTAKCNICVLFYTENMDSSLQVIEPLDYHSCDTPRGSLYFNTSSLTKNQQKQLNTFKIDTIRSDEMYLKSHPEVRAFSSLILQYVLKKKPRKDIHNTVYEFFNRPQCDVRQDMELYLERYCERKECIFESEESEHSSSVLVEEEELVNDESTTETVDTEEFIKGILNTALDELHTKTYSTVDEVSKKGNIMQSAANEYMMNAISAVSVEAVSEDRFHAPKVSQFLDEILLM
ncbi:PREDICTED: uncharacterized protein LOC108567361 [Nicrophorus vespilloides]|uniref:Uncharacterized protein LOC108567361 n=1 Tax=Nicrophorus vespilloides TaxID=110193 RepID=A0ABM1N8W6_NICVS|nr:PREDICTED: uncharacterized protein LOC108567361 [Nicrophorus vespilloides]